MQFAGGYNPLSIYVVSFNCWSEIRTITDLVVLEKCKANEKKYWKIARAIAEQFYDCIENIASLWLAESCPIYR